MKVTDNRENSDGGIRRRRECLKCTKRFTTHERIESMPLKIVKKSGGKEHFNKDKLLKGILRACEKRPVTSEQIDFLLTEIEAELRSNDTQEIHSQVIGELVMEKLMQLDKVAYVRFASVYKDFTDIKSFENMIKELKKGN
jgi:transcriptional repressor NrdR